MTQGAEAMSRTGIAMLMFTFALWLAPASVPAAEAPAGKATAADGADVPDSSLHQAHAPEIDIADLRDPFESYLTVLERKSRKRMQAHRERSPDHEQQPLEGYDLGALRLVATMKMGADRAAMVEDPEGKGYVVRKGSYIGRDNGRVINISERSVEIMEDDFTAAGTVVRRKATLTLNEVNQ